MEDTDAAPSANAPTEDVLILSSMLCPTINIRGIEGQQYSL